MADRNDDDMIIYDFREVPKAEEGGAVDTHKAQPQDEGTAQKVQDTKDEGTTQKSQDTQDAAGQSAQKAQDATGRQTAQEAMQDELR